MLLDGEGECLTPIVRVDIRAEAYCISIQGNGGVRASVIPELLRDLDAVLDFCRDSGIIFKLDGLEPRASSLMILMRFIDHVAETIQRLVVVGVDRRWEQMLRSYGIWNRIEVSETECIAINQLCARTCR